MEVPCGKCLGCKLEYSRQWAVRLTHESSYWDYDKQHFITLTYNNEHLPPTGSLVKSDFQKFMKRLRRHHTKEYGYPDLNWKGEPTIHYPMKFFHAGEYGKKCLNCGKSKFYHGTNSECQNWSETIGRPHYHAILYGSQFPDMEVKEKSDSGSLMYESETLNKLWTDSSTGKPIGFATIGDVTFESCSYVARYVTKKIYGSDAHEHYKKPLEIDKETGEVTKFLELQKEYVTMSRGNRYNPQNAIGIQQYQDWHTDMYPHDRVAMVRNKATILMKPPRYYDILFL